MLFGKVLRCKSSDKGALNAGGTPMTTTEFAQLIGVGAALITALGVARGQMCGQGPCVVLYH